MSSKMNLTFNYDKKWAQVTMEGSLVK